MMQSVRYFAAIAAVAGIVGLIAACGSSDPKTTGTGETPDPAAEPSFVTEIALQVNMKLGGCAAGDLDPSRPGAEVAVVAADGSIYICSRRDSVWTHELVAHLDGEMIQCAVGDVDPDHVGEELVVVGATRGSEDDPGPGSAWLLRATAGGWDLDLIWQDEALIHAVVIADVDASAPGQEVVLAGYGAEVHLAKMVGGLVSVRGLARTSEQLKGVTAVRDGSLYFAGAEGSLLRLRPNETSLTLVQKFPAPLARIGSDGDRVLVSSNDGALRLYEGTMIRTIYTESDRLRGAVFADVDPRHAGLEVVTGGYSGAITVLHAEGSGYVSELVGRDTGKLHHVAAAEILGIGPTLFTCGYAGRLLAITYR